jgi:hypothetical protein
MYNTVYNEKNNIPGGCRKGIKVLALSWIFQIHSRKA